MALIEWALIISALALFTITETYQPYVTLGLGLLAVFFAERGVRGKLVSARTGLELPLLLFILSAGAAVLNSYNQETALLQFARILGAAAVFFLLAENQPPFPEAVAAGLLVAAAGLALYWPVKNDFAQFPAKLGWINAIGLWLNAHIAAPPGPEIQSNVAAGTLLVSLPIGAALAWQSWRKRNSYTSALAALLTLLVLAGLLMTNSRGAWIGLAGTMGMAGLALIQRRWFAGQRAKRGFWLGILAIGLLAALAILAGGYLDKLVGQIPDPTGSMRSRIDLWREGLGLARDYFFTGSGLQTYWMVHAVYGILVHVRYIAHSHNSFLQIWIEQGLLGALSVAWGALIMAGWAWKALDRQDVSPLGWAGLAALLAAGIHGMVDVVFYVERTLPVIGLILGFAALVRAGQPKRILAQGKEPVPAWAVPAVILLLLGVGLVFRRPIAAAWYANLGALKQTQVELARYDPDHFADPTLDQVRQTADLSAAQADLLKALSYAPDNPTALQRLSEIGLARGEYAQSLAWMETAWNAGQRDPVTRLLFGDALVANGQIDQGVQVIRGLTWAESRLLFQAWYRYWSNQNYALAANAWKAVLLLDPSNAEAAQDLANAQKNLNP